MNSSYRPNKIILNSKFRSSGTITNCNFNFIQPIEGVKGARINNFSAIYLVPLINPNQALLKFSILDGGTIYGYYLDLSSLTDKYYEDIDNLMEDINGLLTNLFSGSSAFDPSLKPTLSADYSTYSVIFTAQGSTQVKIEADNSTFWYKLGWENGTTGFAGVLTSPSYASILPLNEVYIVIENFENRNQLLLTNNTSYNNLDNITEIFNFAGINQGDLFKLTTDPEPKFPIKPPPFFQTLQIRLLDSRGGEINLRSDWKIVIDLLY